MPYIKLDYPTFEHILVKHCKCSTRSIITGVAELSAVKVSAENIDSYVLLPAALTESERVEYLGRDFKAITKDALSDFRRGVIPVRDYIRRAYNKEEAVNLASNWFKEKLEILLSEERKKILLEDVWNIVENDLQIPDKYLKRFTEEENRAAKTLVENNNEAFYIFLADAYIFSVLREDILHDEVVLHPVLKQVLNDLSAKGNSSFLHALIDTMFKSVLIKEPDNNDNCIVKQENDTEFSDDDFKAFSMQALPYIGLLNEEYLHKFRVIQQFAISLDLEKASHSGHGGIGRLYDGYGFNDKNYQVISLGKNIENAEMTLQLGDGKPVKLKVKRGTNGGPIAVELIGLDENGNEPDKNQ